MSCKYKYNNTWYSKEELKSILLKERSILPDGKLEKPEIKKDIIKQETTYALVLLDDDGYEKAVIKTDFKTLKEAKEYGEQNKDKYIKYSGSYKYVDVIEEVIGKQPTQTNETLKESISETKRKLNNITAEEKRELDRLVEEGEITSEEEYNNYIFNLHDKINKKEYTSQAEINLKIAALKEVARRYPRSLITSKVVPINPNLVNNSEIQYSKVGSKQDIGGFQKIVNTPGYLQTPEFLKNNPKFDYNRYINSPDKFGREGVLTPEMTPYLTEISLDIPKISEKETVEYNQFVNEFNNTLKEGFLSDFNIDIQEYDSIKESLGFDSSQMVDLVTKFIALNKGELLDKSTAYLAYSLLGKSNNKIKSELKYRISSWEKYSELFEKYKQELLQEKGFINDASKWKNLIRDKIIIDYLAETIVNYYNNPTEFEKIDNKRWSKSDFTFIGKLYRSIKKLLEYLGIGQSSKEILLNTATNLASDILTREYSIYNYKLENDQILKKYNETINSDQKAKDIVEFAQENSIVLTGSLALRKAGTVYRTSDETLHDLDFVVPFENFNSPGNQDILTSVNQLANQGEFSRSDLTLSYLKDLDWFKSFQKKYPTYKVINSFYGSEHKNNESYTIIGVVDGEFDNKNQHIPGTGYVIDFFIRLAPNQDQHENYFKLWKEIMIAKLTMGRSKDFTDYKEFIPYVKSKDSYNFYYPDFVYSVKESTPTIDNKEIFTLIDQDSNHSQFVDNLNNSFGETLVSPTEDGYEILDPSQDLVQSYLPSPVLVSVNGESQVVDASEIISYPTEDSSINYIKDSQGELQMISIDSIDTFYNNLTDTQRNMIGSREDLVTLQQVTDLDDQRFLEYLKCKI